MYKLKYEAVDGYKKYARFKTKKGARAFVERWVGKGEASAWGNYVVSGDGVGKVVGMNCSMVELMREPEPEPMKVYNSPDDWYGDERDEYLEHMAEHEGEHGTLYTMPDPRPKGCHDGEHGPSPNNNNFRPDCEGCTEICHSYKPDCMGNEPHEEGPVPPWERKKKDVDKP